MLSWGRVLWHHQAGTPFLGWEEPAWSSLEAAPDCLAWAGVPWAVVVLVWEGGAQLLCSVFAPLCLCSQAGGMGDLSAQVGAGEGTALSLHAQGLSPSTEE